MTNESTGTEEDETEVHREGTKEPPKQHQCCAGNAQEAE